ncbi:MAG: hypothetical protein H7068_05430, partial [Pedobacter sp.]|nr:hypothetical protein [Chitinophagaceae bacterium]
MDGLLPIINTLQTVTNLKKVVTMKSLNLIFASMFFMYLLFSLLGCQKDIILKDSIGEDAITSTTKTPIVENLGKPFVTTNINYRINPLNPNNAPLFVYHANSNNGYELVMIDNGKTDGQTPLNAFRFITVNLDDNSYKVIVIKDKITGAIITNSVGRIVRYVFGKNKKLYIATEGSFGGGGHIIEYDYYTQTAMDLGKPFKKDSRYLDIYSLNVTTDGTLCGGSFGGSGDVMTFRYNYDNKFDVDAVALDNSSRYVAYISGDEKYTYASCGENNWKLYAIDKITKQKKILLQKSGADNRIELMTRTDAPYATLINTHYLLNNNSIKSLGAYNRPETEQLVYSIYQQATTLLPQVNWADYSKILSYTLPSGQSAHLVINDAVSDNYPTGSALWLNNQLFIASANHSLLGKYDGQWNVLGTTGIDINSIATSPNTTSIFIGGYPKGKLLTYNYSQPYTLNLSTNNDPFIGDKMLANPQPLAMLQDADNNGNHGPINITQMVVTKTGFVVAAGDDDRITSTSGRQLAISSYKAGSIANSAFQGLGNYQFTSMCLNDDSTLAYISAYPIAGGNATIFVYNPATNAIIKNITFQGSNAGKIISLNASKIVG